MSDYWDPEQYAQTAHERINTAFDVLEQCDYRIRGDEAVLDIGCGNGWATKAIFDKVPDGSALGIDLSENMIGYAQEKFADERLSFDATGVLELDMTQQFDLVTSFACLHWVGDQKDVLRRINNALSAQGVAILMFYRKPEALQIALDKVCQQGKWATYFEGFQDGFHDFPLDTYRDYLEQVGIKPTLLQTRTEGTALSRQDLTDIIAGWLPQLERIPLENKACFMNDLIEQYICEMGQVGQEKFTQQWPRIEVRFQKSKAYG